MAEALTVDSEYLLKFPHFQEQEKDYVKYLMGTLANKGHSHNHAQSSSLVQEIEKAREQLKNSLNNVGHRGERKHSQSAENARIKKLEESLHAVLARVAELEAQVRSLTLQGQKPGSSVPAPVAAAPAKPEAKEAAGDDDFDMFGSDNEEDLEAERIRQERVKEYAAKKSTKPTLIAKSNIILDVKPWDDETDLAEVEKKVRSIQCDGLLWGSAKLVPLAYGIKKLQISCVVEDDKVGTDFLEEEITKFEDLVQSVDVAAFNKI